MQAHRFLIYGAGSIGCYVGGCLIHAGHPVRLLGRPAMRNTLATHGLHVSDYLGQNLTIAADKIPFFDRIDQLEKVDTVLLCVKSGDTAEAVASLKGWIDENTVIVSLQNGVDNPDIIKSLLPSVSAIGGMVPFNVVNLGGGRFHRGTEGTLALAPTPASQALAKIFSEAGIETYIPDNFAAIQWTKLIMNLNNAVNALSGIPLLEQLNDLHYRQVMAKVIREALGVLKAAGIKTARVGKVIPGTLPWIMSLPTWAFRRVARAMIAIDPHARSSMYEDLVNGRKTEIDFLNGKIVKLAKSHGVAAPVNEKIQRLVHEAEDKKQGSPRLPAQALL